jgi:hypothetical protein
VKNVDDLPKKYRASAKEALKNTQNSAQRKALEHHLSRPAAPPQWPDQWPDQWQRFFDQPYPYHEPAPPAGPDQHTLEELQKQMRDLEQRLEELERQRKYTPAPAPDEPRQPDETDEQKQPVLEEI